MVASYPGELLEGNRRCLSARNIRYEWHCTYSHGVMTGVYCSNMVNDAEYDGSWSLNHSEGYDEADYEWLLAFNDG